PYDRPSRDTLLRMFLRARHWDLLPQPSWEHQAGDLVEARGESTSAKAGRRAAHQSMRGPHGPVDAARLTDQRYRGATGAARTAPLPRRHTLGDAMDELEVLARQLRRHTMRRRHGTPTVTVLLGEAETSLALLERLFEGALGRLVVTPGAPLPEL